MRFGLLSCIIALWPYSVLASVQISEVAWMGSATSANHEWIELRNTGADQSVDGWILHDANSLTIELSGTIPANEHVVLERTSDASAAGTAFLIYTGALPNTGGTLVLRNADGTVVDQVAGGENWELIGGNNETKDTAQRSGSNWQTAPATPGVLAETNAVATPDQASVTTTASQTGSGTTLSRTETVEQKLTLPGVTLQLALSTPDLLYVGQPATFSVEPSGVGKTIADSLAYEWSMGNGETMSGQEVEYTFMYPGTYVVVVSGEYKRQKQYARQTVTVLPVSLTLKRTLDSTTSILHNHGEHEIDIGGYTLTGVNAYTFPAHTIILPGAQVRVPVPVTHGHSGVVALYDEKQNAVAVHVPGASTAVLAAAPISSQARISQSNNQPTTVVSQAPPVTNFGFVTDKPAEPIPVAVTPNQAPIPAQVAAVAAASDSPLANNWPLYALIVLLFLSTVGIYLVPQKKDDPPWV